MTQVSQRNDRSVNASFTIRELTTLEEFHQAEEAQRVIWSIHDLTEVVPLHMLLTAQKNGGLVLGAFDDKGRMVGFLFGFPGRTPDGRWKHCSHMMGVIPGWRRRGVGEALKWEQRALVLAQRLDLVTWTYDPLEGVNASLNFRKLGVICQTYYRNLYGEMADELNRGLPTDRFQVEWWIDSQRVRSRLEHGPYQARYADWLRDGAQQANRTERREGHRIPVDRDLACEADSLIVEVPADFQGLKAWSLAEAIRWREHTRELFETYLARGYLVTEFTSEPGDGPGDRRNFYLLERKSCVEVLKSTRG